MCIRVAQGKRHKDREALLSPRLLQDLRAYWRVYRPAPWLFPGRDGSQPLALKTAYLIFQRAKSARGLPSRVVSIYSATRSPPISWKPG